MRKSLFVLAAWVLVSSLSPLVAQKRVEASAWYGWAFSDGVSSSSVIPAGDGNFYDRVDPKDSSLFGASFGVYTVEHVQVGFMYSRQMSSLVFSGTAEREVGDMAISTYHGFFGYDFGTDESRIRPFLLIGFGATNFSSVNVNVLGVDRNLPGRTNFSTTWAAGVNVFVAPSVGVRLGARWTPTYIKSDVGGWWCDPYWGCYLAGNPQYSNQAELSGGITVRF